MHAFPVSLWLKKSVAAVDMPPMRRDPVSREWLRLLFALALAMVLMLRPGLGAFAQEPHAGGVVGAWPPEASALEGQGAAAAGTGWKVVYIVGDVDGLEGPTTRLYIGHAQEQAAQLRAQGFTVTEFYAPNNHWPDIVAAAAGAHALIYAGHGMRWGGSDAMVGGMKLNAGESVHPDQIRSDLRMAPGAVAILNHACYSAGSSEEDVHGTTFETAERRVALYSLPFLEAGFSGYYASWYYYFPAALLTSLASGLTYSQAYEAYHDFNPATVTRLSHSLSPGDVLWLDYDDWESWEGLQYSYAFAGDPGHRLGQDPTPAPTLSLSHADLSALSRPGGAPQTVSIQVLAEGGVLPPWEAWVEGGSASWLTLEPRPAEGSLLVHLQPPAVAGDLSAQVIVQPLYYPPLRLPVSLTVAHLTLLPEVRRAG